MTKDFFEMTRETSRALNKTERKIYDFVVKNMAEIKDMSIHKFAALQFVSTTSIFRFTRKLGFLGYVDFTNSLIAAMSNRSFEMNAPEDYSKMYLKNATESIRVMAPENIQKFIDALNKKPDIYILCDDNTHATGQYCEKLLIGLGFHAYFPEAEYQMQNLVNHIEGRDVIIALSYTGEDAALTDFIKNVYLKQKPYLISITKAEGNLLESLSDINFYVFAEGIYLQGMDLTSTVPMLMVLELLVYAYLKNLYKTP